MIAHQKLQFKSTSLKTETDRKYFPADILVVYRNILQLVTDQFSRPRPTQSFILEADKGDENFDIHCGN